MRSIFKVTAHRNLRDWGEGLCQKRGLGVATVGEILQYYMEESLVVVVVVVYAVVNEKA